MGEQPYAWEMVQKEDFDKFIKNYPNELETDLVRICEPEQLQYNDFTGGLIWPESVVAGYEIDRGKHKNHRIRRLM